MPASKHRLTAKQREVYHWYRAYIQQAGESPTTIEAATHFGVCTSTICEHLKWIEHKGWIERDSRKWRNVMLVEA